MNTIHSRVRILLVLLFAPPFPAAPALAQSATAYAAVSAAVVTPLSVVNDRGLDFGSFSADPSGRSGGTAVISAAGTRTLSGLLVPVSSAEGQPAQFTVTGEDGATFTVSVNSVSVELTGGAGVMIASEFEASCASGCAINGPTTFTVGGKLSVEGLQAQGSYSHPAEAGGLQVTISYN